MKRTLALTMSGALFLMVLACLLAPLGAGSVASGDGGGGEDLYGVEPLAETGYEITYDFSGVQIYSNLTQYDSLKQYITVTGPDGEDVTEYILVPSRGTLNSGSNDLYVYVDSEEVGTITINVIQHAVDRIKVVPDSDFEIYDSYGTRHDLIAAQMTVYAYYNDAPNTPVEIEYPAYQIGGKLGYEGGVENANNVTVSYTYNNRTVSDEFYTTVLKQTFYEIKAVFIQTENIPSSETVDELNSGKYGTLTVTGYYTEENQDESDNYRVLNQNEYQITGSLWTKNKTVVTQVNVLIKDETGNLGCTVPVNVQPVSPSELKTFSYQRYYGAGDTFDKDSLMTIITFVGDEEPERQAVSDEIEVIYQNGTDYFKYGDTYVTIKFSENGVTKTETLDVSISESSVDSPQFDSTPWDYNGEEQDRVMSRFDFKAMKVLSVTKDGAPAVVNEDYRIEYDYENDSFTFSAINAGVYVINVGLEEGYNWRNYNGEILSSTWVINRISTDYTLSFTDSLQGVLTPDSNGAYTWIYGDSVTITVNGGDVVVDSQYITWHFGGSANNPGISVSEGTPPTNAGSWTVYADIAQWGNYVKGETPTIRFTIDRATIESPVIDPIEYDGSEHEVSPSVDGRYTLSSNSESNAGTYDATAKIVGDYVYEYQWSNGSDTITVGWAISKKAVTKPVLKDEYHIEYDGIDHSFTEAVDGFDGSTMTDGGTSQSSEGGTHTVSITLTYHENYKWVEQSDEDDPVSVDLDWTISPKPISIPTISDTVYREDEDGEPASQTLTLQGYSGILTITDVSGSTEGIGTDGISVTREHRGDYVLTLSFTNKNNYVWSDTNNAENRTLTWTIEQAENSVTIVDVAESLIYGFNPDTNTFTAESDFGEVVFMFSRDGGQTYRAYDESVNEYGHLDAITWYVKAVVPEHNDYKYAESTDATLFTIAKADNTVTILDYDKSYTYGDDIPDPTHSEIYDANIIFVFSEKPDGTYTDEGGLPKDAGTWYVKAWVSGATNYNDCHSQNYATLVIDEFQIPYPTFEYDGESVAEDGKSFIFNGAVRTPTVVLDVKDYPFEEGIGNALSDNLEGKTNAGTYSVLFTPTNNYEWEDGTQVAEPVDWYISKQPVQIGKFERTQQYNGTQFIPDIQYNEDLCTIFIPVAIERTDEPYEAILTLKDPENYEWRTNGEMMDDEETPWDRIGIGKDSDKMYVGFAITNQEYVLTLQQEGWVYFQDTIPQPVWTIEREEGINYDQVEDAISDPHGHEYQYRLVNEDGSYVGLDSRPTDVGSYEVRLVVYTTTSFEENYTDWDKFEISPAEISNVKINDNGETHTYNGMSNGYSVSSITHREADVRNEDANDVVWKFSTSLDGQYSEVLTLFEAGWHDVYYTVEADNHKTVVPSEDNHIRIYISPISFSVDIEDKTTDYAGSGIANYDLLEIFGDGIQGQLSGKVIEGDDLGIELSFSKDVTSVGVDGSPFIIIGNNSNENYEIQFNEGSLTINPVDIVLSKQPTITGGFTYDAQGHDVSGYISNRDQTADGDTISWKFSLTEDGEYYDTLKILNANETGYTIYYQATASNHIPLSGTVSGSLVVDKRPLEITIDGSNVQFGDDPEFNQPIVGDFAPGETLELTIDVSSSRYTPWENKAGDMFQITVDVSGEGLENYELINKGATLTVIQRDITMVINDTSSIFGESLEPLTFEPLDESDVKPGDNYTKLATVAIENGEVPHDYRVGGYHIVGTDSEPDNYNVTFVGSGDHSREYGIYTIERMDVTIHVPNGQEFTYNGNEQDLYYEIIVNGQQIEEATDSAQIVYYDYTGGVKGGVVDKVIDAGTYLAEITMSGNYSGSTSSDFVVDQADYQELYGIKIKFESTTPEYDRSYKLPYLNLEDYDKSELHGLDWDYLNKNGEVEKGALNVIDGTVTVTVTFSLPDEVSKNVKVPQSISADVKILPKSVTVDWTEKEFVYTGTVQDVLATYKDINGESIELETKAYVNGKETEFKDWLQSGYELRATFKDGDNVDENYVLDESTSSETFDIAKRLVTIIADDKSKVFGDENPVLTWSYPLTAKDENKFVFDGDPNQTDGAIVPANSDIGLEITTTANIDSTVSDERTKYTITIRHQNMDNVSNYQVTVQDDGGELTINPRPLTIELHDQHFTYTGVGPDTISSVRGESENEGAYHIVQWDRPANYSDDSPVYGLRVQLERESGYDAGSYKISDSSHNPNYSLTVVKDKGYCIIDEAMILEYGAYYMKEDYSGPYDGKEHTQDDFTETARVVNNQVWEFRYSSTISDNPDDYSESFMFKDAGEYTVYYVVTAPNHDPAFGHFEFEITTATNEIIHEEIEGWTYLETPNSIVYSTPLDSHPHLTIYKGEDTTGETIDRFESDTPAGKYTIQILLYESVSDNSTEGNTILNYEQDEVVYTIEILRKPVDPPVGWEHPSLTYNEANQTNTLEINGTIMRFGTEDDEGHEYSSGPHTEIEGSVMTMNASSAGEYYAWVCLTDDNYCWSKDDPEERWFKAIWIITKGGNGWDVEFNNFESWTYDGTAHLPDTEGDDADVKPENGTVRFEYSMSENGPFVSTPFVDATPEGETYYIRAVVDATENHSYLESEAIAYHIYKVVVAEVHIIGDTVFTYSPGKTYEVELDIDSNPNNSHISVSGTSGSEAGPYQVTVSLKDEVNYVWEDGDSDSYPIPWVINKATVGFPTYPEEKSDENGGFLTYNLKEQTYEFVYADGTKDLIDVRGDVGTIAKSYEASFTLQDEDNYQWVDEDAAPGGVYTLKWRINPWVLPVPTLDKDRTQYNPDGTFNEVEGFNSDYMSVDTGSRNVSFAVDGKNDIVTLSANMVSTNLPSGVYWIYIKLASDNFAWPENEEAVQDDGRVLLNWEVYPIELDLTAGTFDENEEVTTSIQYDGIRHTYVPGGFEPSIMLIDGYRGTEVGDYEAKVTLIDSTNYVWSELMDRYKGDDGNVYMPWSITAAVFDIDDLTVYTEFVYDGQEHVPEFDGLPSWVNVAFGSGVTYPTGNSGTDVTVTFTCGPNHAFDDTGTTKIEKTYPVHVSKRPVTILVEGAYKVYGGDEPIIEWSYQSGIGLIDGDHTIKTSYDDSKTFETTVEIQWNGSASEYYELQIVPGKLTVIIPEPETDWVEYTGEEVLHPFDKTGAVYTVSEEGSKGTAIGDYTVTLSLNDKTNYVWWDNSNADKKLTWRIVAGDKLSEDFFQVDDSDEIYSGEQIEKSVVSLNPNIRLNEDYVVEYSGDRVNVGQVVLTIRGINDFAGSEPLEYDFEILPRPVSIPESVTKEYDKDGNTVVSGYQSNKFYTVEGTLEAKEVGDYQVTFTLTSSNYVWSDGSNGPKTVTWHIVSEKTLLDEFFVVDTSDETYSGQPFVDRVVCVNKDLVEDEDYWIEYSNNKDASTESNPATITIHGKGDYAESELVYTFTIHKAQPVLHFVYDSFRGFEDDGTLTFRPYVSGISYGDLGWTSSDPSVAYVDPESGTVSVRGVGQATITATFPGDSNREAVAGSFDLNVGEKQTEVVIMPGDTIYVPTVITEEVDGGISDLTWLLILACAVVVMLVLVWLLWNRRTEGDGA